MIKVLLKDKRFLIGFSFISFLVLASIGNTVFNNGDIRQVQSIYIDGQLVETAPFQPSLAFPLGTDPNGYDLFHIVIEGAKYTIGITLLIAFFQLIVGIVIGTILSGYFLRTFKVFEHILETFSVLPVTLVAYFILINVLTMPFDGFAEPFYVRASFEVIILVLLPLPSVVLYIVKEIQKILGMEFIKASKILGASTFRIIFVHVYKHLIQRFVILFIQQFNQTLIILAHLGLLSMFFGGTVIDYSPLQEPPKTLSYEWSGLIGDYFEYFFIHPYIPIVPIIFFSLTIISINLILNSLESTFTKVNKGKQNSDQKVVEDKEASGVQKKVTDHSFEFTTFKNL
ncbi:ABC transporter permease subunit [Bacillus spongiae]|uniref:ABC transporter permease subunit n=1 Tax=Bacillus spongiae TaxID=2683610 RepID=A0ABU8HGZ2_9BACI